MFTLLFHILIFFGFIGGLYYLLLKITKIENRVYSILSYIGMVILGITIFYVISVYDNYYIEKEYAKKPINNIEILNVDNNV